MYFYLLFFLIPLFKEKLDPTLIPQTHLIKNVKDVWANDAKIRGTVKVYIDSVPKLITYTNFRSHKKWNKILVVTITYNSAEYNFYVGI